MTKGGGDPSATLGMTKEPYFFMKESWQAWS